MADAEWTWREELTSLLRACRSRLARPPSPGSRRGGMRQEDVAALAGLSLRRYAAFERGEFIAAADLADRVAAALQMSPAERSALHVLATGQDPPRPVTQPDAGPSGEPSGALRDLVAQLPYPAALTDETWAVLYHNQALNTWSRGWYDTVPPGEHHLICYLFTPAAAALLPDVASLRRFSLAAWRYQYTRNLSSARFGDIVARLTGNGGEAARLWARHEISFPPHEYPVRIRSLDGITEAQVVFVPVRPRLWLYTVILPAGAQAPAS